MDSTDFHTVDYFRGDALVDDPHPYYAHLRAQCPIQREPHHDVLMVTGYDEVREVYADPGTFSACNAVSGPFPGFPVPLQGDDVSDLIEEHRHSLPMSRELMLLDPPEHTKLRTLAMRHFTPRRLGEVEPFIRRVAHRLIDGFADSGTCEFMMDFSGPFAVLNVCFLVGVPEEEHETFRHELLGPRRDRGLGSTSKQTPDDPFGFLHDRFATYIEERRAEPRDDVITRLATTPLADGSMPAPDDVVRLAATMFAAGTGTTTHMLAAALQILGERPDLQQQLQAQRGLIPNFVEEVLRLESPIKGNFRLSRLTKTVAATKIPAGTTVMTVISGANRDPRRFEQPDELRLDRENARHHLAFGHGIHHCAGAALARAEGSIAVDVLLSRLRNIRISEEAHGPAGNRTFEYVPSYMVRGLQRLHLEFERR